MSVKINLGAWSSVFAVPSKIVDEGLKFSDGVKLKVLLYVLRNADRELDLQTISKATGVNVTDIPEALDYWVNLEVLQKNQSGFSPAKAEGFSAQNNSNSEIKLHNTFKSYRFFCTNRRTGREVSIYEKTDKKRNKKFNVKL